MVSILMTMISNQRTPIIFYQVSVYAVKGKIFENSVYECQFVKNCDDIGKKIGRDSRKKKCSKIGR